MRTESEMNARVAKAIKEVEQKKAALAEAKKKASAEKRRRENHHKYMMGGCVAKYFPECYLCNEEELNMVIKAGLESIQCQNVIKSLKEQSDASMAGAKPEEVKSLCMEGSAVELLRCKIHRIYTVRTDISPSGDMCALRGGLQTARHKMLVAYGGSVPPSLQRTQPIGYVLMQMMIKNDVIPEDTLYYLMAFFVEFIRGNIFFLLNKLYGKNRISLKAIPKEVIHIMLILPVFLIMICCLIIDISIEANNSKSFGLCIAAIISVTLSYYLILFVMERFTAFMAKRHEEERYLDELQFKQQFYHEIQDKYEYIQDLKHNFKNQFLECTAYLENNEIDKLKKRIAEANHELEQMDEDMYSCNPILNSILRVKIGLAKKEKIACSIEMMIPADFNMEYGDMGILYGNLLDNAIEACSFVEPDKRFIRMKSKMMNGNLIISVINSKQEKRNVALVTTKLDKENHGRGVRSIRKVVDKYDGTIEFEDKGDTVEVTGILYEVG